MSRDCEACGLTLDLSERGETYNVCMHANCEILVCDDKCMIDFYENLRKINGVAKDLPKVQWGNENNENWQIDDFLLNHISVSLANKNIDCSMETVEAVLLKLLDLGYCL